MIRAIPALRLAVSADVGPVQPACAQDGSGLAARPAPQQDAAITAGLNGQARVAVRVRRAAGHPARTAPSAMQAGGHFGGGHGRTSGSAAMRGVSRPAKRRRDAATTTRRDPILRVSKRPDRIRRSTDRLDKANCAAASGMDSNKGRVSMSASVAQGRDTLPGHDADYLNGLFARSIACRTGEPFCLSGESLSSDLGQRFTRFCKVSGSSL